MALKLKTIFLICAICALAVYGEDTTTSTTPKTTSSSSSSSTSSSSSSTTTTTTSTSTTTTTSTTEAPISTTTKAPPLPAPKVGEWNSTCIKLKFAAQLSFSYNTTDNTTKKSAYNFPTEIITVGDFECNFNETESIILQWVPSNETKVVNSAKFTFYKDEKSYRLGMIHIKLEPKSIFPDANNDSVQLIYANNKTFVCPLEMSYHCTRQETFDFTELMNTKNVTGNITLSNVQIEAFHKADDKHSNTWNFSSARDCDANNTPDIVPIAVGIALSALILIVLISYLVARRRSSSRGYMSF